MYLMYMYKNKESAYLEIGENVTLDVTLGYAMTDSQVDSVAF